MNFSGVFLEIENRVIPGGFVFKPHDLFRIPSNCFETWPNFSRLNVSKTLSRISCFVFSLQNICVFSKGTRQNNIPMLWTDNCLLKKRGGILRMSAKEVIWEIGEGGGGLYLNLEQTRAKWMKAENNNNNNNSRSNNNWSVQPFALTALIAAGLSFPLAASFSLSV